MNVFVCVFMHGRERWSLETRRSCKPMLLSIVRQSIAGTRGHTEVCWLLQTNVCVCECITFVCRFEKRMKVQMGV